jgi:gamma-glutamylcyclotransferase
MLYFAFGSNLLPTRLQRRCPTAKVVARAIARDYRVVFNKLSEDSSGKANLVAGDSRDAATGIVYELSADDLGALDAFEGPGYRRQDDFSVASIDTGENLVTCTYLARNRVPGLKPYDWYLALVLAGLAHHDIDSSYAQKMRLTRFDTDVCRSRNSRRKALQDLRAAGFADYLSLLQQPV